MIKITDYIHCYENLLEKDICKAIIDNSKNLDFIKAQTLDEERNIKTESNPRRC